MVSDGHIFVDEKKKVRRAEHLLDYIVVMGGVGSSENERLPPVFTELPAGSKLCYRVVTIFATALAGNSYCHEPFLILSMAKLFGMH